jgi:hypothetical protein
MRGLLGAVTLVSLNGCGVGESRFIERYNERVCSECEDASVEFCADEDNQDMLMCQEAELSDGAGFGCDELESFFQSGDSFDDCDYDAKAASECLKEEWVCKTDLAPVLYPDYPDICEDVWVCGSATGTASE